MYKKKNNTLSTNITVEKIDTTETLTKYTHTTKNKQRKKQKNEHKTENSNAKNVLSRLSEKSDKKDKKDKKDKNKQQKIVDHLESLDELSLVLSNVSENYEPSNLDTDTLLKKTSKYSRNKNKNKTKNDVDNKQKIVLDFKKNKNIDHIRYNIINNYIKKNIISITELLYTKNLIKNKNIPYRLLFHIYVNYLNDDMKIIFD
tara:strand:+ start:27 stop:632 length:606 start_codon:yes stop_codon:yes gene_type:complete